MNTDSTIWKVFNVIATILAFITLIVFAVLVVNANWEFIKNADILNILKVIQVYAPMGLVAIVCVEFAVTKNFILQILVYLVIAAIVIFQFFPDTWKAIFGG